MNSDSDSSQSSTRNTRIHQIVDSARSLHSDITFDLARLDALVRNAQDDLRILAQSLLRTDGTTQKLQSPASEEAIGSLKTVKVKEVAFECAICLEMMAIDSEGKEMHCKHVFHSVCIEKWLHVSGSCPVCRRTMPAAAAAAVAETEITNNVSFAVDAVDAVALML